MSISGTGKRSVIKGIFTSSTADLGVNSYSGTVLPADNARDAAAKKAVQAEVDSRLTLQRARGVVIDDESGHA